MIREKCLFRRRESLFGSTLNNLEQKTRLQREIEATDRQIDHLVYQLYGLTEEEIKVGNARFWLGENFLKLGYSDGYGGLT